MFVCLRVHGSEIRSDTPKSKTAESPRRAVVDVRGGTADVSAADHRPIRDFEQRRRCVGSLLEDTERETWKASPSTSSR